MRIVISKECALDEAGDNYTPEDAHSDMGGRNMPRTTPFLRCLTGYVEYMQNEARFAERTVQQYRWAILRCHDIVREGNGPDNPMRMAERDLRYLLDHLTGCSRNRQYYWTAFAGFLKWCGNPAILKMRPQWPLSARTHVDWLEPEQATRIRETAMEMDPLTALLVHFELDLCLRRIEIQRLRIRDVHENRLDVLGKGRLGGKPRTVSLVPGESQEIIRRYLEYRQLRMGPASMEDRLVPYKRTALDNRLKALQGASGIRFLGHHTLRRTGGRLMWLAKVPIETIASVMGHESTDMTLKYIGVNLSDQTDAFEAVRNMRIQLQKTPKIVPFRSPPVV